MQVRHPIPSVALVLALAATEIFAATDVKGLRPLAAETSAVLEEAGYIAKVPLERMSTRYVLPDGSPSDKKGRKQGQTTVGASTVQWDDGVKVRQSEIAYGVYVYIKKDRLSVSLNKKKGARLNPAWVHILFDRDITPADLEPEAIADALDSVVLFRGYDAASRMAAAFDEGVAAAPEPDPPHAQPTLNDSPTVLSLEVRAEPSVARAGEDVKLYLEYEIRAPTAAAPTEEIRRLSFAGELVPTYPVREQIAREAGRHVSHYRQPLPASATVGAYRYEGEVCVAGECIRRSVTFEVTP